MLKEILKNIDMFTNLDSEEFNELVNITTLKTLQKDNILFYEGEIPDYFYLLLDGHIKLYKTNIKSQEIVLHHFTTPSMIAEMATLENIRFPATCMAVTDETKIGIIEKEKFKKILENNSKLSVDIIKSLTKKIKNLEISINRNLIFDATTKVCSIVKENPNIFQTKKNIEVANLLNMAPETLSRSITKLKKLNILDENNQLIDIKKLDMFLDF